MLKIIYFIFIFLLFCLSNSQFVRYVAVIDKVGKGWICLPLDGNNVPFESGVMAIFEIDGAGLLIQKCTFTVNLNSDFTDYHISYPDLTFCYSKLNLLNHHLPILELVDFLENQFSNLIPAPGEHNFIPVEGGMYNGAPVDFIAPMFTWKNDGYHIDTPLPVQNIQYCPISIKISTNITFLQKF